MVFDDIEDSWGNEAASDGSASPSRNCHPGPPAHYFKVFPASKFLQNYINPEIMKLTEICHFNYIQLKLYLLWHGSKSKNIA